MDTLKYKKYVGAFKYYPDDQEFHGQVVGIRDVVHFCGASIAELKTALADSVEEYLDMCKADGVDPAKPFSGRFALRLDPEMHRRVATVAKASGKSLNAWMAEAIAQRLEGEAR